MGSGMVTTITPRIMIEECVRLGIKKEKLLAEAALSHDCLQDISNYIPVEKVSVLWEKIMSFQIDQMFGIHAAEKVPFGAYRVLDYMLATSSSPRDGLDRSSRSFGLMNTAFHLSLRHYCDMSYLELSIPDDSHYLSRPYIEYIFTNYLVRLRFVTRMACNPSEVQFTYREPACTQAYDRLFRAPVRFKRAVNRMIFARHIMEIRHPFADPELCELLESYTCQRMAHRSDTKQPLTGFYEALAHHLESGLFSLPDLARHLGKSQRSLQRELSVHGMTFRDLLDHVRQQRARTLLSHHDLPITEVAARLHYSDTVSFCHAFKRWTGISPQQYRKEIDAAGIESKPDTKSAHRLP